MDSFDPNAIDIPHGHFIGGELVPAGPATDHLGVFRPSDNVAYAEIPVADADLVDRAVTNAAQAQRDSGWGRLAPRERARVLRKFADLVDQDIDTLAPLEAVGSTRPVKDAKAWDVPYTAECLRFFAELADKHGGEVAATAPTLLGMTLTEPIGVVAGIVPWNFPLVLTTWKVAPALAAGNAVVIKPSEMTPFSAVRLAQLAIQAGIPAGVFNVVQGNGRTTGDTLVRHPKIGKVSFTGSTRSGAAIMAACAESGIKPVTLELGGKSPQLVFADVPDLDAVTRRIVMGITGNAGQVCNAGSRLIIQRSIADAVMARLVDTFGSFRAGATWSSDTTLSPIINTAQASRIEGLLSRAAADGAVVHCGGGRIDTPIGGAFIAPSILTNVGPSSEIVREEVFGPVLTVQTFDDEEEALALAHHDEYGLAAGVHTADIGRALRLVRGLEAGNVWVNRYGRTGDFIIPTGGYKRSGLGKDLGRQAFEANLRSKSVLIDLNG